MHAQHEQEVNRIAYRALKEGIDRAYPPGWFVAIVRGAVAADAADFPALLVRLESIEKDPERRFVVQAGVEYPEEDIILRSMMSRR